MNYKVTFNLTPTIDIVAWVDSDLVGDLEEAVATAIAWINHERIVVDKDMLDDVIEC